jgi:hypothetical protein
MSFFRRLRRAKEEPATEPPEENPEPTGEDQGIIWSDANRPTPVEESPPDASGPAFERPEEPATAAPIAPTPAPEPVRSPGRSASPPPPLPRPEAVSTVAAPSHAAPLSLCFVCGGPLEGKHCPTCRMTWVE